MNTNIIAMTNNKSQIKNGIALIAVLAILVVLTILAASFSAMMSLELKQSNEQQTSFNLDMLLNSGMEHSKTLLMSASNRSCFPTRFFANNLKAKDSFSKWFYVEDQSGKRVGRYRLKFEDEAGKVNINRARLPNNSKGYGWDTGEINLPMALGVPPKIAKNVIKYRYGSNLLPGGRGDDDYNNVVLMADGIDNNANGIVDENNEGMNDPGEYKSKNLFGDDRKFSTINEAVSILLTTKKKLLFGIRNTLQKEIPYRATIYSTDELGSPTLNNKFPSDINCFTARDCRKLLTKANAKKTFLPGGQKRTQLAVNIVDYRDENHVLSTLGSTYGVEAICFNEVMANDESVTHDLVICRMGYRWTGNWKKQFGMIDDKRCIYCPDIFFGCIPDSPSPKSKVFQVLEPRRAWRINKEKGIGKLTNKGNSWKIEFPKSIGENGNEIDGRLFRRGKNDTKNALAVPKPIPPKYGGDHYRWPDKNEDYPLDKGTDVFSGESHEDYNNHCKDILEVLEKIGKANGDKNYPAFGKDYFKNSLAMVYEWQKDDDADLSSECIGCFEITSSDDDSITFNNESAFNGNSIYSFSSKFADAEMDMENHDLSVTINSWANSRSIAWVPNANQTYLLRSRQPIAGRYFKVIIGRPPKDPNGWETGLNGYPDKLGVSGRIGGPFSEDKNFEKRMWEYNDGKPVRTKQDGWIDVLLTSSPDGIDRGKWKGQNFWFIRMLAPEVSEMYNASATPVSLANWRVICNTGSKAMEIGLIRGTSYYDKKLRRKITTDNPVVEPGGHFYLVNDTKLFDYRYGSGNGEWGSSPKEEIPVFQMDADNWGVAYKIKKVGFVPGMGLSITLDNFDFDAEKVFNNESIKFIDKKRAKDPKSWNNVFTYVRNLEGSQAKDQFFIWELSTQYQKYLKGADLMILGLPYSGGIVSLTLKNEYEQICARTIDYGKVETYELGKSSEKIDPTKNTWVKRSKNTIGGQNKNALNRAMRMRRDETYFIKNGPFGSVGELRHVSTGNDFDRLGGQKGNISKGLESIGAIADVASCSHVRLEAAEGNVTRKGWKEAKGEVENSSLKTITCKNGNLKVDKWKGQSIRFITGPLRGEKFIITGNSKNVITIGDNKTINSPYSAPSRKLCQPNKGDLFSIGPGYASAFCFTRTGGDIGEWTWKKAVSRTSKCEHNLYIYGLNDAIDTTEFFEENNNASIDVDVWNWNIRKFEPLCKKKKYGKQDSFNAGKIGSQHISGSGDFKLRLTAHDITEELQEVDSDETRIDTGGRKTGIAWFNYAAITPVPVPARVNINTAPARLLASLPGITAKLAKNIESGTSRTANKNLKPYKTLGDVMKVKGITPEIFERCANLLCVNSSFFTVEVEAQTVSCTSRSDSPEKNISGERSKRYILKSNGDSEGSVSFDIIEKCSL